MEKKKTWSVQYALRWRPVGNRWRLVGNRWPLVCNRWRLVCNRWRLVCNRWRLVCNRWRLVGNRWRLVGNRWQLVGNRWRLVCNRWRLVCNRWRLVGNRWRLVCNRWRLVCNRWRLVGSHQTSESGCHSKKKKKGARPYGTPWVGGWAGVGRVLRGMSARSDKCYRAGRSRGISCRPNTQHMAQHTMHRNADRRAPCHPRKATPVAPVDEVDPPGGQVVLGTRQAKDCEHSLM